MSLDLFGDYKKGWYYGDGESFDEKTIECARDAIKTLLQIGFDEVEYYPGLIGDIFIEATISSIEFFITVNKDCTYQIYHEDSDEKEHNFDAKDETGFYEYMLMMHKGLSE